MSILSEQERDGLEEVFLSISSTRYSSLKWSFSQHYCYCLLHLKTSFKDFSNDFLPLKKSKNTLKWTISQKNHKKAEKHR